MTRELLRRVPKAELHVHLDGCLRLETMLELAAVDGVALPAVTVEGLLESVAVRSARNLEQYLGRYAHTIAVMQTAHALDRIAYEFVLDVATENIRYVEVRFCPALHTSKLTLPEVIEATVTGLKRGTAESGVRTGLIFSGLRTLSPLISEDIARAAVEYRHDGIVAFDLAGMERGYPAAPHARAFAHAAHCGLHRTCHAGEADGPQSVRQALEACGAERIGHGTRIFEDPSLEAYIREQRIPLEVCLTSNVHTHAVEDIARHPARRYFDMGCVVTLNTDSRLMDQTSLTEEYWLAHTQLGFTRSELEQLILYAFESAFIAEDEKAALVADVRAELEQIRRAE